MIDMNKAAFTAISVLTVLAALSGCATSKKARLTNEFLADLNVLKATCEKYSAGDRVYEQVDGVEGVFKAGVVDPYPDWSSQFGMKAPWANFSTGDDIYTNVGEPKGGSYWYVESPPKYGSEPGGGFRRSYLWPSDRLATADLLTLSDPPPVSDGRVLVDKIRNVTNLRSEYGWVAEDLTTEDMRNHWITGGRLKIFRRSNGSILAERINFYRATGPLVKMAWAIGVGCDNAKSSGYDASRFVADSNPLFIKHVLRPPKFGPSGKQLKTISGD